MLLSTQPFTFPVLCFLLIVQCSTANRTGQSQEAAIETAQQETEPGIYGVVFAKSDIVGQGNSRIDGFVACFDAAAFPDVLAASGFEESGPLAYRRINVTIEEALFRANAIAFAQTGSDGTYRFDVDGGTYCICLGTSEAEDPSQPTSMYVYGCIKAKLEQGKSLQRNLYWGEAGLTAQ